MTPSGLLLLTVTDDSPGHYTAYIHMEADMAIPWSALVPWARDTALLSQHGFHRGFYVLEFHPEGGDAVLTNEIRPVSPFPLPARKQASEDLQILNKAFSRQPGVSTLY